jgi:2-oxoglutarate ferredoxin oxidoreductase subunit delta
VNNPKSRTQRATKKAKGPPHSKGGPSRKAEKGKKHYEQIIFRDWCKACGICSAFCPKGVIGRDETGAPVIEHPEVCIGCRFCELHCPDFAITINEQKHKGAKHAS